MSVGAGTDSAIDFELSESVHDDLADRQANPEPVPADGVPTAVRRAAALRASIEGDDVDEVLRSLPPLPDAPRAQPGAPLDRGGVPVMRVGNDAACDFVASAASAGLQQALDAAGSDANGAGETEIRLANTGNYTNRRYFLNDSFGGDQSVTIIGGYSSCSAAFPIGTTTLDRGTATLGPVLLIDQTAASELVVLERLVLTGGGHTLGGGIEIRNNNFVILEGVEISGNWADDGGGVSVTDADDGTQTVLWLRGASRVNDNLSTIRGGGLLCWGEQALVALDTDAAIAGNRSLVNGGGIFVGSGCLMDSFAGYPAGIYANTAEYNGGGAYIENGGRLTLIGGTGGFGFGNALRRTTLDSNSAHRSGGGVYVTDSGSRFVARDATVIGNTADSDDDGLGSGGGGAVVDGGAFIMDRTLAGFACHRSLRCSRLAANYGNSGGAIWAMGDDVEIDLRQTWIENNRVVAGGIGSAILISNLAGDPFLPARLFMEGSMVVNNQPQATGASVQGTIDVQGNTDTTIAYSTFADNLIGEFGREVSATNTATIRTYASIFHESTGRVFGANWTVNTGHADCILTFNDENFPPAMTAILEDGPQFDADYLLTGSSPAVDYCDDLVYAPVESDISGNARGVDTEGVPVHLGPFDLGAAEFVGVLNGGLGSLFPTIHEVDEDVGSVEITVRRSGGSEGVAEFRVRTVNGSAVAGSDFVALDQTVVFDDGDNLPKSVTVEIIDDGLAEPAEQFQLQMTHASGSGGTGSPSVLAIRIYDNEQGVFADGFEGPGSL